MYIKENTTLQNEVKRMSKTNLKWYKVFNTINGIESLCGGYQATNEIEACVDHIRRAGGVINKKLTEIPAGYRVVDITPFKDQNA
jgi:hypothetical protein